MGELPASQTYQFVQQPFPTPIITQHHLQDVSVPQQTFQPSAIPVTPTHLQTIKPHQEQLHTTPVHHIEKPSVVTEHSKEQHILVPPSPELNTKQSEQEKISSAWIPNLQTLQFLSAVGSGLMNKQQIDQQYLTSPGIVIDEPQVM